MKNILSLLILFLPLLMAAQPVLESLTPVLPGTKVTATAIPSFDATAGMSGADVVWDFNNLDFSTAVPVSSEYLLPSQTPSGAMYLTADIAEKNSAGIYNYYKTGNQKTELLSVYLQQLSAYMTYSDAYIQAKAPLSFNEQYTDTFYGFAFSPFVTNYRKGTVEAKYDAYGTLLLKGIEYRDVIRIRSVAVELDSVVNATIGSVVTGRVIESYTWVRQGSMLPLLVNLNVTAFYRNNGITDSLPAASTFTAYNIDQVAGTRDTENSYWQVNPDPLKNHCIISNHCIIRNAAGGRGKLISLQGQLVKEFEIDSNDYNLFIPELEGGMYVLEIESREKTSRQRVLVENMGL